MGNVEVYYNLHKKCFSIRAQGKVVGHADTVKIRWAKFVVQPAGRDRVVKEGRKNVHAFVRGQLDRTRREPDLSDYRLASYNPYKHGYFVDAETEDPLWAASDVILHEGKAYYKGHARRLREGNLWQRS